MIYQAYSSCLCSLICNDLFSLILFLSCRGACSTSVLIVVIMVRLEDLLSKFLLSLMNISIKLISVLSDWELLVIINWDEDFLVAVGFIFGVVELGHVRVTKCLFCSQTSVRVEMQKVFQEVKCIITSGRENVSQLLGFGGWKRFQHSLSQWAIDSLDIIIGRSSNDFHNSIELV